eukprot:CAMPEP_0117799298 /NCGR_PEP_ID=MMETSP0948-20121206/13689_1 /TAXON_ID=44440 /ORGANISM="Chattonella subsalsa, Strain CCMP2191" /LENGTH=175 /DNA_ID=CAMNT_0005631155 /DNA_START=197 /DNA_END=725 /DNA_ORIENTATION=+
MTAISVSTVTPSIPVTIGLVRGPPITIAVCPGFAISATAAMPPPTAATVFAVSTLSPTGISLFFLFLPSLDSSFTNVFQLCSNLNKTHVQLSAEMISQTAVAVVDGEESPADVADPELLVYIRAVKAPTTLASGFCPGATMATADDSRSIFACDKGSDHLPKEIQQSEPRVTAAE